MFDLSNVSTKRNFDNIPDGKYTCFVTEAKMQDTKSGGMMIKTTLTVADGEYEGRKIFTNFNVENSNPKAVEIGLAQLKSLLENGGHKDPNKLGGVEELNGLRVGVKTKTRKSDDYGDQVGVSYYFKPTETAAPSTTEDIGF